MFFVNHSMALIIIQENKGNIYHGLQPMRINNYFQLRVLAILFLHTKYPNIFCTFVLSF